MKKKLIKYNISNRLADHLINAILIFASVFLAFWMNEIREERKTNEYTYTAKEAIISELKTNLDILERWAPYHKDILEKGMDSFQYQIDTIGQFGLEYIPGYNGSIQKEIITINGIKLIEDNQLKFDIKTKMMLNRIYKQHDYVFNATSRITDDFLGQRERFDKTKVKENYLIFYNLIAELWGQEHALISRLKETINDLEK